MLTEDTYKHLKSLADEVSAREGCRVYDIEYTGPSHAKILRVYIEALENGVDIDQCANVSRGLSLLLDVEDVVPGGAYDLEVSSPGLERPLRLPWHFTEALGQKVKVKTVKSILQDKKNKLKQVTGQLSAADETQITVDDGTTTWEIELENIHKAQVLYEFSKPNEKHKRRGK